MKSVEDMRNHKKVSNIVVGNSNVVVAGEWVSSEKGSSTDIVQLCEVYTSRKRQHGNVSSERRWWVKWCWVRRKDSLPIVSILELPVVLISTMAGAYQYVFAIIIEKENWTIKVKVIRLWYFPSFSGSKAPFSLEMVLMDEEGGKVRASVGKTLTYNLKVF
ncbi:hypothetical protein D0Y65_000980 [Glycine soja]|nr:hypothetical protein D0Y65_000980 [Glycine soja]RZC29207.1 hypothetical protein D0Y65_000980 [Glycine soja]RZC29208.1 hypothetical protein D0Y65_000980 [Glycine soja]RZC29209.1 hypothetical protein D0Y65_000980 [Glycine soja]